MRSPLPLRFEARAAPLARADEPGSEEVRNAIRTVYATLDRTVGEMVEMAPPGTTVLLVSDHGFGGTGDRVLHVNRYLAEKGFLAFRNGFSMALGFAVRRRRAKHRAQAERASYPHPRAFWGVECPAL